MRLILQDGLWIVHLPFGVIIIMIIYNICQSHKTMNLGLDFGTGLRRFLLKTGSGSCSKLPLFTTWILSLEVQFL